MVAPNEPPSGQIVPDDVYEKVIGQGDSGPLKGLEETQAEQDAADEAGEAVVDEQDDGTVPGADKVEAKTETTEPKTEPDAETIPASAVREEVEKLLQDVREAVAKRAEEPVAAKTEQPVEEVIPAHIQRLLDHDDPEVRASGEAYLQEHRETQERLAAVEERQHESDVARAAEVLDRHIEETSSKCDPPLTDAEKDEVVAFLTDESQGQALASTLTFEQGVLLKFPGRMATTKGPTTTPAKKAGEGNGPVVKVGSQRPTATVVDRGGAAGAVPTVRKPPDPNESLEQAINRGFRDLRL